MVDSPTLETFVIRMTMDENLICWGITEWTRHTGSPENKAMIKNAKKKKGVRGFN